MPNFSQGPRFPASGTDGAPGGTVVWSNPSRITVDDGSVATAHLVNNADFSDALIGTNFGFSIPLAATILGIFAEIKRSDPFLDIIDNFVELVISGSANAATNKGIITPSWPASLTYQGYGGSTDLWTLTTATITPAVVNATNFGLALSATPNAGSNETANVDAFRMTIYYSLPTTFFSFSVN